MRVATQSESCGSEESDVETAEAVSLIAVHGSRSPAKPRRKRDAKVRASFDGLRGGPT